MNTYNDQARCTACGSTRIAAKYCTGHEKPDRTFADPPITHHAPLIHRTCNNCGFTWDELPINSATDFGPNKIANGDLSKSA